jgi:hypothetical protein
VERLDEPRQRFPNVADERVKLGRSLGVERLPRRR